MNVESVSDDWNEIGRQVGRKKGGHLQKGRSENKSASSIPTRYVTLINPEKQQKGFGIAADRFGPNPNDEFPGPGNYSIPCAAFSPSRSDPSRGKGGLASHAKRFSVPNSLTRPLPGPGQYETNTTSFSQTNIASSAFHKPPEIHTEAELTPGPGEYSFEEKVSRESIPSAAFRSKSGRMFTNQKFNEVPGPGQYEQTDVLRNLTTKQKQKQTQKQKQKQTQKFKHSFNFDLDLGIDSEGHSGRERSRTAPVPGPGQYEPDPTATMFDPAGKYIQKRRLHEKEKQRPIRGLCIAPSLEKNENKMKSKNQPGPGDYEITTAFTETRIPISSAFQSTVKRSQCIEQASVSNPSPFNYNPTTPPTRVSFQRRARHNQWI